MTQSNFRRALGELTIIVLGVLIALFAESAWNDYQDQADGRKYLARLAIEARQNLAVIRDDQSWAQWSCSSAKHASSLLRLPEDRQEPAAFLRSAVLASLYSNPRYQRVTFDDLVGTGGLSFISDAALRTKIIAAYTELFEVLDAWRPPKDTPLRTVVIRTLPGDFVNNISSECLEEEDSESGADTYTLRACSTAPVGTTIDHLFALVKETPGLDGYLLERAWQTCEFDEDSTAAVEMLEDLLTTLESTVQ